MLVEGFYTKLNNSFTNEYSSPNKNGDVTYQRINASDGAFVRDINFKLNNSHFNFNTEPNIKCSALIYSINPYQI
ncbi:hypothetical protein [Lutibacter citreus]|uniref:hypothetical protein n=1 Tax=Lutibacter citreus TaxID=2138210 RepID=UPI000DBE7C49|nr:hypothetical protein [Lutibacter citreus]